MRFFFSREQRFSVSEGFKGFSAENKDLVFVNVLSTCEGFFSRQQRFSVCDSTCEG